MSENQKLREALLSDMDIAVLRMPVNMAFAGNMAQFQYHNRVQSLLNRIDALALPTADHLPDAGEMVVDHFPDATKMINGLTQAETDASASVSGLTAAPVVEREAFENEMRHVDVWGHRSLKKRASGNYENWQVNLMWDVWQARAALSAGDAADAQRYRWLKGRSQVCLNQVWIGGYTTRQRDVDFLSKEDALSAIDAAIDAAMRKGQL